MDNNDAEFDIRTYADGMTPKEEYRILVSSQGAKRVMEDIWGEVELGKCIKLVREKYPNDTIYVRQVLESVVMVIAPDGTVTRL